MIDLSPLLQAARQAAIVCQHVQRKHIDRSAKSGSEPVTLADYGAQAVLCRAIQQYFPQDAVMSEESGQQFKSLLDKHQRQQITTIVGEVLGIQAHEDEIAAWLDQGAGHETERMWVIDPLDGTKGYLRRQHYVVAVALMLNRQPVAGILAAPEYPGGGVLLYAYDGRAYREPLGGGDACPIHVSGVDDASHMRTVVSGSKTETSAARLRRVHQLAGIKTPAQEADSQEKYGRIACGDADLYLRLPRIHSTRPYSIWDHASGVAILQAAGGLVTDVDGSPLDFSTGTALQNQGVVATNGPLHEHVLKAVQQLIKEEQA